jgi:hypothetical protein
MKRIKFLRISFIFIVASLLIFTLKNRAQHHPDFIPVSEQIKERFDDRQKRIDQELSGLPVNEWAGRYFAQMGLIDGAVFNWSPSNGFTIQSGNSFHRGIERVNYGSVNFNGKLLTLSPEFLENTKHTYDIPTFFIPVKWDQQHWLIPSDDLRLFIYAVNSGDYDEIHSFFLRDEDTKKSNDGLPNVPKAYRKYLNLKPFRAKVIDVRTNNSAYMDFTLTLNAGRSKGVIKGMKFYLIKVKNALVWIRITDVREHKSEADIVSIGNSAGSDEEIKPAVGWEFTSKMPQNF